MIDYVKAILKGQFEAALCMFEECVRLCPDEHWDGKVGKYAFWHVAYHTLCCTDGYLSPDEKSFELRPIHPGGWKDLEDEYPSRRFEKPEIIDYTAVCRQKAAEAIAAETHASLEGPSGFARRTISRGELYIYNTRHIQHHTGQLGAYLRRIGEPLQKPELLKWVQSGWNAAAPNRVR